ncbi:MAG: LysR family transcriptional regulator, partial [Pigmentiphaga sp.]
MDLKQLACFVAVSEELNFHRAARRMHISQPPFSRQIANLESAVGVTLLERSPQSVRLTEAGAALLPIARQMLQLAASAPGVAQRAARGEIGRLRVGFVGSTIFTKVPPSVGAFRRRYPEVDVSLTQLTVAKQVARLLSEELDVGIIRQSITHPELSTFSLFKEAFYVVLPAHHPLASRSALSLKDLGEERFVSFSRHEAPAIYEQMLQLCDAAGFSPNIVQEADPMSTVVGLVASGVGVAIVPESMTKLEVLNAVYFPLKETKTFSEFFLAWRSKDTSRTLANFIDVLKDAFREE